MNSMLKTILFFSFMIAVSLAQTSHRYHETFTTNNELGWAFIGDAAIGVQSGQLTVSTTNDDFLWIMPPIGATRDDFSVRVIPGSIMEGQDEGGFGRAGFNSLVGVIFGDDDSIKIIYTENIQSYENPNFTVLGGVPIPSQVNSAQMDVARSGNNMIINVYINDVSIYSGQVNNVDEGLFYGHLTFFIIPEEGPGVMEWSVDEIDFRYNPYIQNPGSFADGFDNPRVPWYRFGDLDLVAQAVTINNSRINFNYSGANETFLYVISPVGAVKDFVIEGEGGAGTNHNGNFSISRFFDYKNYITMFYDGDLVKVGYSINAYEPTILASTQISPSQFFKFKFSIEGNAPNLTIKVWVNDVLVINTSMNNATQRLGVGHIAMGFDSGNNIDAYLNNASTTYSQFVTSVDDSKGINPSSFSLSQNYPNPFNPSTTIKYSVPLNVKSQTSDVKLIVYDILGNEVATLVNERKAPGIYEVNFSAGSSGDAGNLASGIYIYRLTTGSFIESRKMLLLK